MLGNKIDQLPRILLQFVREGWIFASYFQLRQLVLCMSCRLNEQWIRIFNNKQGRYFYIVDCIESITHDRICIGLQKIFMLKNLTCGFLAVSPLIGASLLGSN